MGNDAAAGCLMREFTTGHAGYEAELTVGERVALAQLAGELLMLLETGSESTGSGSGADDVDEQMPQFSQGPVSEPEDPVLRRLVPDAAPSEPDVGAEFRRLTQQDLLASKRDRLKALITKLIADDIALEFDSQDSKTHVRSAELLVLRAEAQDFASALTDLRLALSERMGVRTDVDSEELHDDVLAGWEGAQVLDDEAQHLGTLFLFAGFLQESLVTEMLTDLRGGR